MPDLSRRTASPEEIEGLTNYQQKVFWTLPTRDEAHARGGSMSPRVVALKIYGGNTNLSHRKLLAIEQALKVLLEKRLAFRGNVSTWFRVPVEEQAWDRKHGDGPATGDATDPSTGEVRKPSYHMPGERNASM